MNNSLVTFIDLSYQLRTDILELGVDLHNRQHRDPGLCKYCNMSKTPKHLVMHCQANHV